MVKDLRRETDLFINVAPSIIIHLVVPYTWKDSEDIILGPDYFDICLNV